MHEDIVKPTKNMILKNRREWAGEKKEHREV
jgi:hypothetical protein